MEHYMEDCKALLSDIKEQDKSFRLKRRWLMDLPLLEGEQKRMKKLNPLLDKNVPETLLREDDIYYDNIKAFVERGFGVHNSVKEQYLYQEILQNFDLYGSLKNPSSLLDEMTNNGLCCFADLVTDGSVKYEKTRRKMKQIVNNYLPIFLSQREDVSQIRKEKIAHLLKNREYFSRDHAGLHPATEAFRVAAIGVLNRLEELPPLALSAMQRKLKGKRGYIPKLEHKKSYRKRDLIGPVRNCCIRMLLELDGREQPQEPLVKALAVAGLTLKLILGHPSVMEFQKFSPEVESLQSDIAKAIALISSGKKVNIMKLEALCKMFISSPDMKFSKRSLRYAIRNLFMEYLLECSDMDVVPENLLQALFDINRCHTSSSCSSSKKEIEEEVECLLCLSSQTKQIVWDLHPELEVDLDFSDAYMEDLEESDDEEEKEVELPESCKVLPCDSRGLTESMGETIPISSDLPVSVSSLPSPNSSLNIKQETMHVGEMGSIQSHHFSHYPQESKMSNNIQSSNGEELPFDYLGRSLSPDFRAVASPGQQIKIELSATPSGLGSEGVYKVKREETVDEYAENVILPYPGSAGGVVDVLHPRQCRNGNQYLSIQKACDETIMVVYRIVGSMLNDFAQAEHLQLTELRHGDISYLQSDARDDPKVRKRNC